MKGWLLSVKPVTQDTHDHILDGYEKNIQEVNVEKVGDFQTNLLSLAAVPRAFEKCQTLRSMALQRLKPQTCLVWSTAKHRL